MRARQRTDPSFNGADIVLQTAGACQPHDGLRQRQRVLGAMVNFPGQKILSFLRASAFGDVDGDSAQTHHAAALVDRCGRRASAPALLAVRPDDAKLRFTGARAALEMADRLAQPADIVPVEQFLDVAGGHLEIPGIDAENPVLPLVPYPVAIDPVP